MPYFIVVTLELDGSYHTFDVRALAVAKCLGMNALVALRGAWILHRDKRRQKTRGGAEGVYSMLCGVCMDFCWDLL